MGSRQESQVVEISQLVTHVQRLTARDSTAVPSTGSSSTAVSSPAVSGGDSVREKVPSSPFESSREFHHAQTTASDPRSPVGSPSDEPMQLGRTRLSPEERHRRRIEGRCIYCAQLGHFIASCPAKEGAHQ